MADAGPRMLGDLPAVPEITLTAPGDLDRHLRESDRPFLVRGLVADWPLVQAGKRSADDARAYLLGFSRDVPFVASVGEPGGDGRLFYNAAMQMNFRMARGKLPEIFAKMDASEKTGENLPIYLASIDMHEFFDGLHAANHVDLGDRVTLDSIWMGTPTRIAAHNDVPDNLACVAVGRRRFTLFPRDAFRDLYLGPLDNTPAGRAVSMVDFSDPDFAAHPRFRDALAQAQVAEMEPGDALYIPALWWHHVEALDAFNVLVNFWWRESPRWLGHPQDALNHAILAIRDLPDDHKAYWRDMFDYYVFGNDDAVTAHIPEQGRSILSPLTPESASRIRSYLLRQLSR